MTHKTFLIFHFSFFIFFVPGAIFSEALSLETARVMALEGSAALQKANLSVQSAEKDRKSDFFSYLPSPSAGISAGATLFDSKNPENNIADSINASAHLSISEKLPIFDGGTAKIRTALLNIAEQSARLDALGA
jgi:outer membrane protein TolC